MKWTIILCFVSRNFQKCKTVPTFWAKNSVLFTYVWKYKAIWICNVDRIFQFKDWCLLFFKFIQVHCLYDLIMIHWTFVFISKCLSACQHRVFRIHYFWLVYPCIRQQILLMKYFLRAWKNNAFHCSQQKTFLCKFHSFSKHIYRKC